MMPAPMTYGTVAIWFAIMTLLISGSPLRAQDAADDFLRYGDLVYAEAAQVPSDSGDLARMDVLVRVAYDYLVFIRSDRAQKDSAFTAGAGISVEVTNERSLTIFARDEKAVLFAPDFATTNTRDAYLLLRQTVYLPEGDYTVHVLIDDAHSTRERRIPLRIRLRAPSTEGPAILSAFPVSYKPTFDRPDLAALGFGGRFLFATPSFLAVSAIAPDAAVWTFRLNRITEESKAPVWNDTLPAMGIAGVIGGGRARGIVPGFGLGVYSARLNGVLRVFQLPLESLDAGAYELEIGVSSGNSFDQYTYPFSIFWKDMPLTLKNPEMAIDIMRYILSDAEYRAMDKGSDEERTERIRAYWKEQDPSPGTPYNERMVEYFRRADQAYYKFQTTTVTNGALTDRGKIYILYGPPDAVDRVLEPGALAQEVWTYRAPTKTVRFVDRNRNGNLRLAE
jgi:GWxTD domain-containing protein